MTPRSLMALCREKGVRCVEVRYMCLNGQMERFHIPADRLSEELFEVGLPFDTASESPSHASPNAALVPLAGTAYLAPFRSQTTLVLLAEIQDAVTHRDDDFDPRGILQRATEAWKATGVCDKVLIGQTCEVLLLRSLQCRQTEIASELQIQPLSENGEFLVSQDLQKTDATKNAFIEPTSKVWQEQGSVGDVSTYCGEVLQHLSEVGIDVEQASDSGAYPGYCRFRLAAVEPVRAADIHLLTCEIIRVTASKYGLIACFLPTVNSHLPQLGWELRISPVKSGESLVTGSKQFGLSDNGISLTAGLLKHLGACMALTNPSDISYHRLQEVFKRNQEHATSGSVHPLIKVLASTSQLIDRTIELSFCDQTCNPYLSIAALLMAALNGIEDNLSLDESGNLAANGDREHKKVRRFPMTLERSIARLVADHDFLLAHDVFSIEVLKVWRKLLLRNRMRMYQDLSPASEFLTRYRG